MRIGRTVIALLLMVVLAGMASPDDGHRQVIDLRGPWAFRLGDDSEWAKPGYDDAAWAPIFVPAAWEDEGYPGYDGYAWYRKRVMIPSELKGRALYLHLGRVDDVDEVYLNGRWVGGQGEMRNGYKTAYHMDRVYRLPAEDLRFGEENVIAVRVYDRELSGGILDGRVGIYEDPDAPPLVVDLAGNWRFRTGDDLAWRAPKMDDADWRTLQVPGYWEAQGVAGYNGYAWYRKTVTIPPRAAREDLVLVLGRIDDLDQVFLDGHYVGGVGALEAREVRGDEWQVLRAYRLPAHLVRPGAAQTIAVRVYDGLVDGGLYEGPVGIMTAKTYEAWQAAQQRGRTFWDFWDSWFGDS